MAKEFGEVTLKEDRRSRQTHLNPISFDTDITTAGLISTFCVTTRRVKQVKPFVSSKQVKFWRFS